METLIGVFCITDISWYTTFIHIEFPLVPNNPIHPSGFVTITDIIYLGVSVRSNIPDSFVVPVHLYIFKSLYN